ncbi:MAG: HD-GYP domain-containing protein [Lachnospiraceae bacterium]|nr:HD-GYP domain-containing protein [Lachnospiraceae bacterium]
MRRIHARDVKPGMTVASDVFALNNQLVIPKGVVLNNKTISKLSFYSVPFIQVEDEIISEETKEPMTYHEKIQNDPQFKVFKAKFEDEVYNFKNQLNDVVNQNAPIDLDSLLTTSTNIVNSAPHSVNILTLLSNMHTYDDETFAHCMNVSLICNLFAKWLHLSEDEINTATLCGLLHDIGKLTIPESILRKPAKLTDEEYRKIKEHPRAGYQILKDNKIEPHICNAALMHHERSDGTGYPLRIKDEQIDPYAKIVAIADVYDATTSPRVYRGPMCPFDVIGIFERDGLQKYSPEYILVILENIVNTYLLETVKLSDGRDGQVIYINKEHLARPTVKIDNTYLDLSANKEVNIIEII